LGIGIKIRFFKYSVMNIPCHNTHNYNNVVSK
jgi:hypothetical protein